MDKENLERLRAYNSTIEQLRERARQVCLDELAKTLPERQARAVEIYKANQPQWYKEMVK